MSSGLLNVFVFSIIDTVGVYSNEGEGDNVDDGNEYSLAVVVVLIVFGFLVVSKLNSGMGLKLN
jgi:hypothetical protein